MSDFNPSEQLYARIKPYDKSRGYIAVNRVVLCVKFQGGDGISLVPRWYPVNSAQAEALSKELQPLGLSPKHDGPKLFDIVDATTKDEIDSYENEIRGRASSGAFANMAFDGQLTLARAAELLRVQKVSAQRDTQVTDISDRARKRVDLRVMGSVSAEVPGQKQEREPNKPVQLTAREAQQEAALAIENASLNPLPPEGSVDISEMKSPGRMAAIAGFQEHNVGVGPGDSDEEAAAEMDKVLSANSPRKDRDGVSGDEKELDDVPAIKLPPPPKSKEKKSKRGK